MKITKTQLKEAVRKIVREKLKEQSLTRNFDIDSLDDERVEYWEDEEWGRDAFEADTERARDRSYEDEADMWLRKLGIEEQSSRAMVQNKHGGDAIEKATNFVRRLLGKGGMKNAKFFAIMNKKFPEDLVDLVYSDMVYTGELVRGYEDDVYIDADEALDEQRHDPSEEELRNREIDWEPEYPMEDWYIIDPEVEFPIPEDDDERHLIDPDLDEQGYSYKGWAGDEEEQQDEIEPPEEDPMRDLEF